MESIVNVNVKCSVSPETCAGSCRADSLSVIHGCNSASLTNFVVWGAWSWRHTSMPLSLNLFSKLYFLEPSRKWCAAGTVHASMPGRAKNVQESPWSTRAARKYLSRERKGLQHAFCNHVAIPFFRFVCLKMTGPSKKVGHCFFTCSNGPGVWSAVQLVCSTHCSSISIICRKCLNKSLFACHCNVITARHKSATKAAISGTLICSHRRFGCLLFTRSPSNDSLQNKADLSLDADEVTTPRALCSQPEHTAQCGAETELRFFFFFFFFLNSYAS